MRGGVRYGVYVHNPDGDMGEGMILGAFKDAEAAYDRAQKINEAAAAEGHEFDVEAIALPLWPGRRSIREVIRAVMS